jgi:hypothetical protein
MVEAKTAEDGSIAMFPVGPAAALERPPAYDHLIGEVGQAQLDPRIPL